jgi:nifR3 family TIM-barrel protein
MAKQAAWIEDTIGANLAYIDINMGCPARKIVSKGDGSALMQTPDLAAEIVRAVKSAVSAPVTAKFRRGFAEGDETAPAFAKILEDAGADALCVHGRYSRQMYRGSADWDCVAKVKSSVTVPVIGNGDVKSASDALELHERSTCDAIMIARAAQGNPWIFTQVQAALHGYPAPQSPTISEKLAMAMRHARLLEQREGKNIARMRKHAMWYVSGLPGAAEARGRLNYCSTLQDFEQVFQELAAYASMS